MDYKQKYLKYKIKYLELQKLYGGDYADTMILFTKYIYGIDDHTNVTNIISKLKTKEDFYKLRDNVLVIIGTLCDKSKIQTIITSQTQDDTKIKTDCEIFGLIAKGNLSTDAQNNEIKLNFEKLLNQNNDILITNIKKHLNEIDGFKNNFNTYFGTQLGLFNNITKDNLDKVNDDKNKESISTILNIIKNNDLYKYYLYYLILLSNKKNSIQNKQIKNILLLLTNKIFELIMSEIAITSQNGGNGDKDTLSKKLKLAIATFALIISPLLVVGLVIMFLKAITIG